MTPKIPYMGSLAVLLIHLLTSLVRLSRPSGHKALIAENLLLKRQLLVIARTRQRVPHLKTIDRLILGWLALRLSPGRIAKSAIIIKPATAFMDVLPRACEGQPVEHRSIQM